MYFRTEKRGSRADPFDSSPPLFSSSSKPAGTFIQYVLYVGSKSMEKIGYVVLKSTRYNIFHKSRLIIS
jgi:hypothetical protein